MRRIVDLLLMCSFLNPYFYCTESHELVCQKPHWFKCNNGKCIPFESECDNHDDCGDKSDEQNCKNFKLEVPVSIQCAKDEFRCKNSDCIPKGKFCDAVPDCTDNSDEYIGCVKELDCRHKFRCSDGHCVLKHWVCDGMKDCPDGSDEQNCDNKTINASDCTNENDRYLCKNQRCISLSMVCDKKDNCGDGSDEGDGCKNGTILCVLKRCSHMCRMTPNGPVCSCRPGYMLQDNCKCIDIDECATYGICDQRCINTKGSYKCSCETSYRLLDDKRTCRAEGGDATMVYSTKTEIHALYLNSKIHFILANNLNKVIDIGINGDHLYWSEFEGDKQTIVKSFFGTKKNVIVTTGLGMLKDIAIDWITGNIYFTDYHYKRIGVCDNNGTYCTTLINEHNNNPEGLALLPIKGTMYWSNWGPNAHIAMAGMDGKNRRLFVSKNIQWPKSMTIDYPNNRLYWFDVTLGIVESIRLDGTDRRVVLHEFIHKPFSLAVFENRLYWSDWIEKTIQSCDKFTGKNWKIIARSVNTLYGIHIDHSALKPKTHNPCNLSPCSQLCMLNQNKSYTCACTPDKELNSDEHTCQDVEKIQHIIIATNGAFIDYYHNLLGIPKMSTYDFFRRITAVTYDSLSGIVIAYDQFKNNIIRYNPVNGGVKALMSMRNKILGGMAFDDIGNNLYLSNIERKTIEVHSLSTIANTSFYFEEQPYDIAVVPKEGIMFVVFRGENGYHVDKMQMNGIGIRTKFVESNLLGPKVSLCYDTDQNRIFWSDQGTGVIESAEITGFNKYLFRTGLNEPISLAIAGKYVFWTQRGSDILFWAEKNDIPYKINSVVIRMPEKIEIAHLVALHGKIVHEKYGCQDKNGNCSHVCLPSSATSYICACPLEMMLSMDNHTCRTQSVCPPGEIKCSEHDICIKRQQWCNGIKECPNGEDEPDGCREAGNCEKDKFMCKNGQCINKKDRCNWHFDCADKSDEDDCKTIPCQKDEFKCHNGNCISNSLVCNGWVDCFDASDELNCETRKCLSDEFMCGTGKCIPKIKECDGHLDCPDGSDEAIKFCQRASQMSTCNDQQFKCANGRCISSSTECDGFNDCGDESDEEDCINEKHDRTKCSEDMILCFQGNKCYLKQQKCDQFQDCPHNDDEHNCMYCSQDQFACDNREKCIPRSWVCDNRDDCLDKSDEKECDEYNWRNMTANVSRICDEFMCSNGVCLSFNKVCDGVPNCLDGSDEQGNCTTSCMQNNCQGLCHKTPEGGVCGCIKGYRLANDFESCHDINECEYDVCSQSCHNIPGSFECSCFDGYIIHDDYISCKVIGEPMEVIAVTNRNIKKIFLNTQSTEVIQSISNMNVTGFDVNAVDNTIYWSYYTSNKILSNMGTIYKLNIKTKKLKSITGFGYLEGLAVDWITNNIYFVDSIFYIKACNLEKEQCALIIESRYRITSLAVNPTNRLLFWSKQYSKNSETYSEICRANMMGSNIKVIAVRNIGVVSAMAIDHIKSKLYWADTFYRTIESSDFNGNQRNILLQTDIYQPLDISIYENSLYWLIGLTGKLQKCKLYGDKSCETINISVIDSTRKSQHCSYGNKPRESLSLCETVNIDMDNVPKYFAISHVSNQPLADNPCKIMKCDHMCVLNDEALCICQDGTLKPSRQSCAGYNSNLKAIFSSNAVIPSESTSHYGGIFITLVVILLVLVCLFYYQRKKLKMTALSKLSIHFQNPSYDRRDEVAATIISTASNISPGQYEYANPINDRMLTVIQEDKTKQLKMRSTSKLEKKEDHTTQK